MAEHKDCNLGFAFSPEQVHEAYENFLGIKPDADGHFDEKMVENAYEKIVPFLERAAQEVHRMIHMDFEAIEGALMLLIISKGKLPPAPLGVDAMVMTLALHGVMDYVYNKLKEEKLS